MTTTTLRRAVPAGEALRYEDALRTGDAVGLTDERLLASTDDGVESIAFADVEEITIESFDWFLAVLSAALTGFGVVSLPRSVLLGAAFALLGVASLLRTYGRRGEVTVHVRGRAKPRRLYPTDVEGLRAALGPHLDDGRRDEESPH